MIDIMPTVVDLAGATYPTTFAGNTIQPEEGVSIVPAFNSSTASLNRTQPLFWEHEGNRAINDGKWKLVALNNHPWELYDYYADRSELHDLASQHPDVVAKLSAEWDAWAKRVGAIEAYPDLKAKKGKKGKKANAEEDAPDA
jgi:arylsulfatase